MYPDLLDIMGNPPKYRIKFRFNKATPVKYDFKINNKKKKIEQHKLPYTKPRMRAGLRILSFYRYIQRKRKSLCIVEIVSHVTRFQ